MANTTATAEITIAATPQQIWTALTDPKLVKQYLLGTDMSAEWKKGGTIIYRGEWEGQSYEDKGVILEIEPEQRIVMDYFSPVSGKTDIPQNHQKITYQIVPQSNMSKLVVTQANNADETAAKKSAANWQSILQSLKQLVEK